MLSEFLDRLYYEKTGICSDRVEILNKAQHTVWRREISKLPAICDDRSSTKVTSYFDELKIPYQYPGTSVGNISSRSSERPACLLIPAIQLAVAVSHLKLTRRRLSLVWWPGLTAVVTLPLPLARHILVHECRSARSGKPSYGALRRCD